MQKLAFLRAWPFSYTSLQIQIYAFRDRLRISRKTSQGMEAYFRFFLSIFPTDFEHINDSQCKKNKKNYTKNMISFKKIVNSSFYFSSRI